MPAAIVFALSSANPAEIAYVSRGELYTRRCDASGMPTGAPVRVCKAPKGDLSWTSPNMIQLDAFGDGGLYQISPQAGTKPRKVPLPASPKRFPSPAGNAAIEVNGRSQPFLIEPGGKRIQLAQAIDGAPLWSPKGDHIGLVIASGSGGIAEVIGYPSLRNERGLGQGVNMFFSSFSPDGKWVATGYGPNDGRGASIAEIATKRRADLPRLSGLDSLYLADWSPDSSKVLICGDELHVAAPVKSHALAIYEVRTGFPREIANSQDAEEPVFCPDGKHLLWLNSRQNAVVQADVARPSIRRIILRGVKKFALRR